MQPPHLQARQTHHNYDQSWDDAGHFGVQNTPLHVLHPYHGQPQQIAVHASRVRPKLSSYRSYALHSMPNTATPSYMRYASPISPDTPVTPQQPSMLYEPVYSPPTSQVMSTSAHSHPAHGHMYYDNMNTWNTHDAVQSLQAPPQYRNNHHHHPSPNTGYTAAGPILSVPPPVASYTPEPYYFASGHASTPNSHNSHIKNNSPSFNSVQTSPSPTQHSLVHIDDHKNAAFMSSVQEDVEFAYPLPDLPPTRRQQHQQQNGRNVMRQPSSSRAKKRGRQVSFSAASAQTASDPSDSSPCTSDASEDASSDDNNDADSNESHFISSYKPSMKHANAHAQNTIDSDNRSSCQWTHSSAQDSMVSIDFEQTTTANRTKTSHRLANEGFAKPIHESYPNKSSRPSHLLLLENGNKIYDKNGATETLLGETLARQILFLPFGEKLINKLVAKMYEVRVPRNAYLAKQNEIGDVFFVVERGKFVILQRHVQQQANETETETEGIIKVTGTAAAKCAFGEESLLYASRRRATYQAKEDSVVWALDCTEFLRVRKKNSKKRSVKNSKKLSFLRNVALFQRVRTEDILDVTDAIKLILYPKDAHIITANERNTHLFMVYQGECQRSSSASKSKKIYKYGDYFGANAILSDTKAKYSVIAKSDQVICYVLNATEFKKLYTPPNQNHNNKSIAYEPLLVTADTKFAAKVQTKLRGLSFCGVIGRGEFGQVSLVEDRQGRTYALKKIRKNRVVDAKQERHIQNERLILSSLNSAFCIALYATYADELCVYFLLEAVLGGELFCVLSFNKKFTEKHARFYAGCVVLAFQHIHRKNVIFRDLKPENLLLCSNGYLKLVDFGSAKLRDTSCTLLGTPEYFAPEIISCGQQSFVTDWWCLGVFIFEMVVGKAPFLDDSCVKMYDKILTAAVEFPMRPKLSNRARDLVTVLLRKHPYKRLGFGVHGVKDIQSHAWFENFDWLALQNQQMQAPYLPKIAHKKDLSHFEHFEQQDVDEQLLPDDNGQLFAWCNAF